MEIIAWQADEDIVRFVYKTPSGKFEVVRCLDFGALCVFLKHSGAIKLDDNVNIWEYANSLS